MACNAFGLLLLASLALGGCAPRRTIVSRAGPTHPNLNIVLALQPPVPRQLDSATISVTLTDARGRLISGATVTADLAMPDMDMGKNAVPLTPQGPGEYTGRGRFTMPGDWRITVTAQKADGHCVCVFPVSVR